MHEPSRNDDKHKMEKQFWAKLKVFNKIKRCER